MIFPKDRRQLFTSTQDSGQIIGLYAYISVLIYMLQFQNN
jgi:hypothetical protein